jgi:hypothetical protein
VEGGDARAGEHHEHSSLELTPLKDEDARRHCPPEVIDVRIPGERAELCKDHRECSAAEERRNLMPTHVRLASEELAIVLMRRPRLASEERAIVLMRRPRLASEELATVLRRKARPASEERATVLMRRARRREGDGNCDHGGTFEMRMAMKKLTINKEILELLLIETLVLLTNSLRIDWHHIELLFIGIMFMITKSRDEARTTFNIDSLSITDE